MGRLQTKSRDSPKSLNIKNQTIKKYTRRTSSRWSCHTSVCVRNVFQSTQQPSRFSLFPNLVCRRRASGLAPCTAAGVPMRSPGSCRCALWRQLTRPWRSSRPFRMLAAHAPVPGSDTRFVGSNVSPAARRRGFPLKTRLPGERQGTGGARLFPTRPPDPPHAGAQGAFRCSSRCWPR